ncbi:MAG: FAD-dependent oxidoreductase [Hyphomicrobium sp.]|nr:FAD-dependent oxidoreductase [Hyphomicrobium sp.]
MEHRYQCAIAGGGPAGLMLGVLLARAGVHVVVIEKHADFLRDFRGDTIHPSTMGVMDELGWLEEFLALPHQRVRELIAQFGAERIKLADFSRLAVKTPYIAMMPQWDFLNFLAAKGKSYPNFKLVMNTEATDLLYDLGRVVGLIAKSPGEDLMTLSARLVVAADGRSSRLRERAGLRPMDLGAPMDVLWFRLPRKPSDTQETQARFDAGRLFIMLNRGDYWQCAFVIGKGLNEQVRAVGLEAFHARMAPLLPFEPMRMQALTHWDQVALLTVKVDRLARWARPGLLCIGDAAHAMSPVGGVGVNLAVQDAVAAANILAEPLRTGSVDFADLMRVQERREFPTRITQRLQIIVQNTIIKRALDGATTMRPPLLLRLLLATPYLGKLPARLVGLGVRPEHVSQAIRTGSG